MTSITTEEILIERKLTFRNSTFGGVKAYIRAYHRKTGDLLSTAAAVDRLLRVQLAYLLDRKPVAEMMSLSKPQGVAALQAVADPLEAPPEMCISDSPNRERMDP